MTGTFEIQCGMLIWRCQKELLRLQAWGADAVRVQAVQGDEFLTLPHALDAEPPLAQDARIELDEEGAILSNGRLLTRISNSGRIRFTDAVTGLPLLDEREEHFTRPPARRWRPLPGSTHRLEVSFQACDGERFWGLGQHPHGRLDNKGCVIELEQRNSEVCIPWLVSSRGYGFLWNSPAIGRVELGNNLTRWVSEATRQMDYVVIAGGTPGEILERYTALTGRPPMLPAWAAGFWQSKLRYASQAELLEVAREYRRRGLPLDVLVIDFFHWTMQGDWKFDPSAWPDPAGMVRELEALGVRVMVSVWPTVNHYSENFPKMRDLGYLARSEQGSQVQKMMFDIFPNREAPLSYYDPTHPGARQFIWERVKEGYYQHGIKIWWLDADEPEIMPFDHELLRYHLGPAMQVGCAYPLFHQQAFYDGMRAAGEREIITLSRSAWAGSQRYGAAVWSGDIASTFESLRAQVRAGLNIAMSGIPWWTTDIGGFYGGDIDSPLFRELIVRWFQFGVFCPLFRLHGHRRSSQGQTAAGGEVPNEIWSFGEEAYAILRELLLLRERLKLYLLEQTAQASATGLPPMRPLLVDFPSDPAALDVDDQFMLGPDLLVAPILEEGSRSRRVYLPTGAGWVDAWDGEVHPGGETILVCAPLERVPAFWRQGSQWLFSFSPAGGA